MCSGKGPGLIRYQDHITKVNNMSDKTDTGTERVVQDVVWLRSHDDGIEMNREASCRCWGIAGLLESLAAERDALAIVRDGLNELLAAERKQNAELYDAVDWDTFDCGGERGGKLLRMFGGGLSDKTDPKSLAPPAAPSEQDNTTGKETT